MARTPIGKELEGRSGHSLMWIVASDRMDKMMDGQAAHIVAHTQTTIANQPPARSAGLAPPQTIKGLSLKTSKQTKTA